VLFVRPRMDMKQKLQKLLPLHVFFLSRTMRDDGEAGSGPQASLMGGGSRSGVRDIIAGGTPYSDVTSIRRPTRRRSRRER